MSQPTTPPPLAWVPELVVAVNIATGGQIASWSVVDDVDPLKKRVVLSLHEDWSSHDYHPFVRLAGGFATANKCVLERVRVGAGKLVLELSIRRRLGPKMMNNPLK